MVSDTSRNRKRAGRALVVGAVLTVLLGAGDALAEVKTRFLDAPVLLASLTDSSPEVESEVLAHERGTGLEATPGASAQEEDRIGVILWDDPWGELQRRQSAGVGKVGQFSSSVSGHP